MMVDMMMVQNFSNIAIGRNDFFSWIVLHLQEVNCQEQFFLNSRFLVVEVF